MHHTNFCSISTRCYNFSAVYSGSQQDFGNDVIYFSWIGEEPLDLSNVYFLAMDWKNQEKCKPYVMVQSKDLVSINTLHVDNLFK